MAPADIVETAGPWAYVVVFALTAGETGAFIGLLLPGETLILLAAALAGRGGLNPFVLAGVVVAGGIVGDSIGYALGRWYGHRPGVRWLSRWSRRVGGVGRARDFLRDRGGAAVFIGRFIGFVRSFLPFAAGGAGMPYPRFLRYSAAASLVWGVGNVVAGYFLGAAAERLLRTVGLAGAGALVALALVALLLLRIRRHRRRSSKADPNEHPEPRPAAQETGADPELASELASAGPSRYPSRSAREPDLRSVYGRTSTLYETRTRDTPAPRNRCRALTHGRVDTRTRGRGSRC